MGEAPISDLAEINPPLKNVPAENAIVGFVPMQVVREQGGLYEVQEVYYREVSRGFTRFQDHDVLFAKITPCMENGKGAHVKNLPGGMGCGSTEFFVLRARPEADSGYVYQLMQWKRTRIKAEAFMSGSAGQQRVLPIFFQRYEAFAPPKEVQRKIARILQTIDQAIEKTEALIDKYQQIKAGLRHDLFTRGIGADGQLRPSPEQAPELYHETPIGWLPKEWRVFRVEEVFDIDAGITLGAHRQPIDMACPYLRVGNVFKEELRLEEISYLEASEEESLRLSLQKHDLLLVEGHASVAQIGRCAIVDKDAEGMLFQNHLFRLRPKEVSPYFAMYFLNSFSARRYWETNCSTSSGLNTINRRMLNRMPIAIPTKMEQLRLEKSLGAIARELCCLRASVEELNKQKAGLMNDLLKGKVSVQVESEPETELEAAHV